MSVYAGPEVPNDGLILCLDANNSKSIKGRTSIINWHNWSLGSGSVSGYGQNGSTIENERVSGTDPWGITNIVWETRPTGTTDADGGWNTDWFNIDRSKLYRFSVWVKRTSSTAGGTFYLGMYANGDGSRRMDNGAVEGNAYWECSGISRFTQNQWYLVVGHVYPSTTTNTGQHPDTGIYTTSGGKVMAINACNIGSGDLKWSNNSTQGLHRTYHYYCSDNTSRLQFFQPRVDLIDGNEPSIVDLLNNAGSTWFDLSGNNNHGTLYNNPAYSPTSGVPSVVMNGINQWIGNTTLQGGYSDFTLELVFFHNGLDQQSSYGVLSMGTNGNYGPMFYCHTDCMGSHYFPGSPGGDYPGGMGNWTNNSWNFFTWVFGNTTASSATGYLQTYINGVYNTGTLNYDFHNSGLGRGSNGYGLSTYSGGAQNYKGSYNLFRVYNRALSASEVKQNYDSIRGRFGI